MGLCQAKKLFSWQAKVQTKIPIHPTEWDKTSDNS